MKKSRNRQILEDIKKNNPKFKDMIIGESNNDDFDTFEDSGMWSLWEEWEWEEYCRNKNKSI